MVAPLATNVTIQKFETSSKLPTIQLFEFLQYQPSPFPYCRREPSKLHTLAYGSTSNLSGRVEVKTLVRRNSGIVKTTVDR